MSDFFYSAWIRQSPAEGGSVTAPSRRAIRKWVHARFPGAVVSDILLVRRGKAARRVGY